ncbi:MAG: efflux RND transporter periplasmic adaptor subunit [Syntrophales bacterium]
MMKKIPRIKGRLVWRMVVMLAAVCIVFGAIFGYKTYESYKNRKSRAERRAPPVTVSVMKAQFHTWQPHIKAVGSLRAVRGVNVTSEIAGQVRTLHFASGDIVEKGKLLVQLNADVEIAQLHSLQASAELARIVFERDTKQYAARAISRATLDADYANLKNTRAQVAQLAATVAKKSIRAPFAGKLGISTVNPGQYINPGDVIVTLQTLHPIYMDFYLPQQELSRVTLGQAVSVTVDSYPNRMFSGKITAINPLVDPGSRNVQVEATLDNPGHLLLPGMYASADITAGVAERYLTLPQTAVTFNPYGDVVYIIEEGPRGPDGKPVLIARQRFVTVNGTRGDQIAILKGIREGDIVVTSGQQKLKSGSIVVINNEVTPSNKAAPIPVDE